MPPVRDRANAMLATAAMSVSLFLDYDPATLAVTAVTVDNQSGWTIRVEAETIAKVRGQTVYGGAFPPGLTSVAIPKQANLTVGFDPNDGDAPFLSGLARLTFAEPA